MCSVIYNQFQDTVCLYFNEYPKPNTLKALKDNSFRKSNNILCWTTKKTSQAVNAASKISKAASPKRKTKGKAKPDITASVSYVNCAYCKYNRKGKTCELCNGKKVL